MNINEYSITTLVLYFSLTLLQPSLASEERVPTKPLSLKISFQMALKQSESLRIQQENIEQSNAQARASVAGAYPNLSWNISDFIQDTSGTQSVGGPGVNNTFTQKERVESKFTLEQPLFSGFREFSAHAAFLKQSERDALILKKASLDLYKNLSMTFYAIIQLELDLKNTRTSLKLSDDRVKELKQRAELGKTRQSEVLSADAQLASLKAQETQLLGQIKNQRQLLSYYIGKDIPDETQLIDEIVLSTPTPAIETYFLKAQSRSDLEAQKLDLEVQRLRIRYEKGSYWPTADFLGNYYTKRPSFYKDIDWDILLTLGVPIYQGGRVSANVRNALSKYRQSKFTLEQLGRQVRLEILQSYINFGSTLDQIKALEQAYLGAQKSYEIQVKEYRLGLVNNLEVIQALNMMQDDKKSWDAALVQSKLDFIRLNIAAENLAFQ